MAEAGQALLGIGMGTGDRRAMDAVEHAIESPLLETSLEGARSILLSITGGRDLSLWEVNEAAKAVAEAAHPDANIIFGAMVDEKVDDQVWVTVVATGYGDRPLHRRARARRTRPASRPTPSRSVRRSRERVGREHARRHRRARVRPARLTPHGGGYGSRRMRGVVAAGHPLTARGRGRRAARRRQRGRRRRGRGADVVRGRVAAHRAGRRRLHARAHGGGRGPPARLLRRRARARPRRARAGRRSCRSTCASPRTRSSASTSGRRRAAPTAPRSASREALERFGTRARSAT